MVGHAEQLLVGGSDLGEAAHRSHLVAEPFWLRDGGLPRQPAVNAPRNNREDQLLQIARHWLCQDTNCSL